MPDIDAQTLVERLEARLSAETLEALQTLRQLTDAASLDLYLVGGAVRDLLLQRDNVDLDLAIEADVAPIAQALASALGGRCVLHERFGTAIVSGPGFHLDLARTRSETYAHPGALPAVAPATLEADLARRDFTINSMALRLSETPELIDPHGGVADIGAGVIRVLHERSFEDDPTRTLRAARYAARLGFQLESQTYGWLGSDVAYLNAVSGPRVRRELQLMFGESSAPEAASWSHHEGIFSFIDGSLAMYDGYAPAWRAAMNGTHYAPLDELGFCIVLETLRRGEVQRLIDRLHLQGRIETALLDYVRVCDQTDEWATLAAMRNDPVAAVETLEHAAPSAVWATGIVAGGATAETCETYLREWRHVRPLLRGDDVIALGVQPGVAVGEALRALRDARLTGKTTTRESEEALVRAIVQGRSG